MVDTTGMSPEQYEAYLTELANKPKPQVTPPFGTPEYTEFYYNNPSGAGYVPNNPNIVDVNRETGQVAVINQNTGKSEVSGKVTNLFPAKIPDTATPEEKQAIQDMINKREIPSYAQITDVKKDDAPPFGTPEYVEYFYNNKKGSGYVPNNPNIVHVDRSTGNVLVVNRNTGNYLMKDNSGNFIDMTNPNKPVKVNADIAGKVTSLARGTNPENLTKEQKETINLLRNTKSIPSYADVTGITTNKDGTVSIKYSIPVNTLKVSYHEPDDRNAKQKFNDMKKSGDIPSNAVFISETEKGINYSVPLDNSGVQPVGITQLFDELEQKIKSYSRNNKDYYTSNKLTDYDITPILGATGLAIAIPGVGYAETPIEVAIAGLALLLYSGNWAYQNRATLVNAVNEIRLSLGNKFNAFAVDASGNIKNISTEMSKGIDGIAKTLGASTITRTKDDLFFPTPLIYKGKGESQTTMPLPNTKTKVSDILPNLTITKGKPLEGYKLAPPNTQDIIITDPLNTYTKTAKDSFISAVAVAESVKRVNEVVDLSAKEWQQINDIFDNIRDRKEAVQEAESIIGASIASSESSVDDIHRLLADYAYRKALLEEAKKQFIQSLNPNPLNGNLDMNTITAISTASAMAMSNALNLPAPTKAQTLDTYIAKVANITVPVDPLPVLTQKVITDVANKTITKPATATLPKTITGTITNIKTGTRTGTKTATQTLTQIMPKVLTQSKVGTLTDVATKTNVKADTKTATAELTQELTQDIPLKIKVKLHNGTEKELSLKDIKGTIAWKQGLMYIAIIPPYGKDDVIYSREPIFGVEYHKGIGSAYESVIKTGGKVPKIVKLDMGFEDIVIKTLKSTPVMSYIREPGQRKSKKADNNKKSMHAISKIRRGKDENIGNIYLR